MDTVTHAALEAVLTLLLFFGATGVCHLAIKAVRRAHSDTHPKH